MIPPGNHTDWPWPLSRIPRRYTAIASNQPPHGFEARGAHVVATAPTDVPKPGYWTLAWSRFGFMFSVCTPSGWLFRIGTARFDYVDSYYEIPTLALKKHA